MSFFQKKPAPGREDAHVKKLLPAAVVLLVALTAGSILLFCRYIEDNLFEERNRHFIEISDKATGIISAVVDHYWATLQAAENLLERSAPMDRGLLAEQLGGIQACLSLEQGTLLTFDSTAHFCASDGSDGSWRDTGILTNGEARQMSLIKLGYRPNDADYTLFIKTLEHPLELANRRVTHIGIAIDVEIFQAAMDIDLFEGQSHLYVVDPEGRRLFRQEHASGFIEGTNLLTALGRCEFIHGGTIEDLRGNLSNRDSGGYEIRYGQEGWFVAASPVAGTDWAVLTFVPEATLGAGSVAFLHKIILWNAVTAVLAVLLSALAAGYVSLRRGDQRTSEIQRQSGERLREAEDAAAAASLAKNDFLSRMSRDIRAPLDNILSVADMALKDPNDLSHLQESLTRIRGTSNRLRRLVAGVLDMSQLENGMARLLHEPMDLRELAEECALETERHMQGRNLRFIREFQQMRHPHLLGDAPHLQQVLINLLSNAVRLTPDGGKIFFRVQELDSDGESAVFRLEVEDSGIGLEPEVLERIFTAAGQETDNNGLDLAVARQFAELMGGTFTVDSRPEEGSRFTVELSLEIDVAAEEIETKEIEQQQPLLHGITLLLAEDNELNMEIAQCILEDYGIRSVPAVNGQEAVDAFAGNPPGTFDGILMDMMMPVMDGLAATRMIRSLPREDAKTIPIFAVTVNAFPEDERRCIEAGMNAHIVKPIDGDILIRTLSHYIQPEYGMEEEGEAPEEAGKLSKGKLE